MKIKATPSVFQGFHPKLEIVLLLFKDVDNKTHLKESQHLLQNSEKLVRMEFNKDTLRSHRLIAPWVAAHLDLGGKARHYPTSVEKLITSVLAKKNIASRDVATNLITSLSLRQIIPIGIDDADKINGDIVFTVVSNGKMKERTFLYKDAKGVLGEKFDYWKNKRTVPSAKSRSLLVHLEILPPISVAQRNAIVQDLVRSIQGFCGGRWKLGVLNKKRMSVTL